MVCSYGAVMQAITLNALGSRITTLHAGGNVQFAIYNNGSWGRPSTLVAATASVTAAACGAGRRSSSGAYSSWIVLVLPEHRMMPLWFSRHGGEWRCQPLSLIAHEAVPGTGPATPIIGFSAHGV